VAGVAAALDELPREPAARRTLADICRGAGLDATATVFAPAGDTG
jgi:hypothetical protein